MIGRLIAAVMLATTPAPVMVHSFKRVFTDEFLARPITDWDSFAAEERRDYVAALAKEFDLFGAQVGIFALCMSNAAHGMDTDEMRISEAAFACAMYSEKVTRE